MRRFMIEREIPSIGAAGADQLRAAAQQSNRVLCELGPQIQWVESFVASDKTYCVYLAADEAVIHEHARRSGFPATRVTEVPGRIDPMTAGR